MQDTSRINPLLIHVLPRLTPTRCGVSDQAVLLAAELKRTFGVDGAFIVVNSDEQSKVPFPVTYCPPEQLLESSLVHAGGRLTAILVHVSGYGYSANGAPTLLAEALERLREDGRFNIAAYFHELFASGPPWSSAFWHSRRQQKAVRKIAELCDLLATNIGLHARWLDRETVKRSSIPIQLLPVFSAAGESQVVVPVPQRDPAMAIFGLPATRRRAYNELLSLRDFLGALGIEEIRDIGMECDVPFEINGIPVRRKGALGVSELGQEVSQVTYGFLSYPGFALGKSSIFAAYCAQGAIPVIANGFEGELDGLRDGVHLLSPKTAHAVTASGLDRYSMQAWRWYSGHRIRVHAETYARWLNQPVPIDDRAEARI